MNGPFEGILLVLHPANYVLVSIDFALFDLEVIKAEGILVRHLIVPGLKFIYLLFQIHDLARVVGCPVDGGSLVALKLVRHCPLV